MTESCATTPNPVAKRRLWVWAAAALVLGLLAGCSVPGGVPSTPSAAAADPNLTEAQFDRLTAAIQADGIPGHQLTSARTSTAAELDVSQLPERCRGLGELMTSGYLKAVNASDPLETARVGVELWRPGTDLAAVIKASNACASSAGKATREYEVDGASVTWLAWEDATQISLFLSVGNVLFLCRISQTSEADQDEIVAALLADYQAVRG